MLDHTPQDLLVLIAAEKWGKHPEEILTMTSKYWWKRFLYYQSSLSDYHDKKTSELKEEK